MTKKKSRGSITFNLEGFHGVALTDLRVGWKDMVAKQCISTCKWKSIMCNSPGKEKIYSYNNSTESEVP